MLRKKTISSVRQPLFLVVSVPAHLSIPLPGPFHALVSVSVSVHVLLLYLSSSIHPGYLHVVNRL